MPRRTEKEKQLLIEKLINNPKTVTDRELASLRRSNCLSSANLFRVVNEQWRRDLLKEVSRVSGYLPEKLKRVSDYPEDKISPRLPGRLKYSLKEILDGKDKIDV